MFVRTRSRPGTAAPGACSGVWRSWSLAGSGNASGPADDPGDRTTPRILRPHLHPSRSGSVGVASPRQATQWGEDFADRDEFGLHSAELRVGASLGPPPCSPSSQGMEPPVNPGRFTRKADSNSPEPRRSWTGVRLPHARFSCSWSRPGSAAAWRGMSFSVGFEPPELARRPRKCLGFFNANKREPQAGPRRSPSPLGPGSWDLTHPEAQDEARSFSV